MSDITENILRYVPVRTSHILEQRAGEELVLLNTSTEESFYINASAAFIWQLIDNERNGRQILEVISELYTGAPQASEVVEALSWLEEAGLISFDV